MSSVLTESLYHVELIDGREVQKPLPKKFHAIIQSYLIAVLTARLPKRQYQVLSELNVLCGEDHRDRVVPDITVALRAAVYREGDLLGPAVLCVEILSRGQTLSTLLDRSERLLKAGTPLCWVIWPERRQAWTYAQEDLRVADETLIVPMNEGKTIEVSLAEMWAELD